MYNPYNHEATTMEESVRNFKKFLLVQKIASGSIRSYLSDIHFFFNWLTGFLVSKKIIVRQSSSRANEESRGIPFLGGKDYERKGFLHFGRNDEVGNGRGLPPMSHRETNKPARTIIEGQDRLEGQEGKEGTGSDPRKSPPIWRAGATYPCESLLKYVNEAVLNAYKGSLEDSNTPVKTINRRFSALRKFGTFAKDQNWTSKNIFASLRNISPNIPFPEHEYHLEEFKANLWKNKASRLTIKNYLNDVKQFLLWQKSAKYKVQN